ncbi:hypothetical protein [Bradyrhizobium sp. AUGA SZCCT0160]|uniref:hypothetical protein n=1 Tax=Bradyrhizobium sp. AUGA SZCCT0160 TaxID=2807662 RepID=UPI001BAD112E|nr:hypothetical protein [Bradyrhizobium sp. AUGA SZCCT0160]MBR1187356.1 hypothetical protein [Bradyrhizobium sp. AUGA SZCCT0160]
MSAVKFPEVEPFGEVYHLNDAGHSNEVLRFGYRVAGTDTVLASIAVPLSVVQRALPREVSARLDPNGTIYVSLELDELGGSAHFEEITLVRLVEQLLESRNLSMEEIEASELETLLWTFEASIQLVKAALANVKAREKRIGR